MRPSAFHLIFPLTLPQQSLFDHYRLPVSPVLAGSGQFRSPVSCIDGELDTEAPQLHCASRPVGMKLPAVFFAVVHLYAYALRINHHIFLDGRAGFRATLTACASKLGREAQAFLPLITGRFSSCSITFRETLGCEWRGYRVFSPFESSPGWHSEVCKIMCSFHF